MLQPKVWNLRHSRYESLKIPKLLDFFFCVNKSHANKKKAQRAKCLSATDSAAATAVTYRFMKDIVEMYKFDSVVAENVTELITDAEDSDAAKVVEDFEAMGYDTDKFVLFADHTCPYLQEAIVLNCFPWTQSLNNKKL